MARLDFDLVRHALTTARENGIVDVQIELGEDKFSASLTPSKPTAKAKAAVVETPLICVDGLVDVKANLVGYYRLGKKPLTVGDRVSKGDVLGVLAALGIANDLESPESGEVIEVLVEPDQPVQYGQVLARIKP